jgi:hypothetical protein
MECRACGHTLNIGDFPFCPHESVYAQPAQHFDPVVIHKDAEGNVRFPGRADAAVPAGFEKVELRTVREVRQFEHMMNVRGRAESEQAAYNRTQTFDRESRVRRAELLQRMPGLQPFSRDLAKVAMQQREMRQGSKNKPFDVGFHVEAFSQNSSNRGAHCDESSGWQRRKG